jgi:NAD+ synthase (glutamine-hydrolysing)
MKIALCQIDPTVGDLDGNAEKIRGFAERAAAAGARVALFPELALVGYPPRDLLDRPDFLAQAEAKVTALAAELPPALSVLVGCVGVNRQAGQPGVYNGLAHIEGGKVLRIIRKVLLPTYDVFDERRYFAAGEGPEVVEVDGCRLGVTICEDIWAEPAAPRASRYPESPVGALLAEGVDCLINVAASPFTREKLQSREELLAAVATSRGVPVVFVNQVGANDELIFDGQSALFMPDGQVTARAKAFEEDLVLLSLEDGGTVVDAPASEEAAVLKALALGTRDYVGKTGFRSVVLGLSGGIDSALTAAIAVDALGPENVLGVALPTRFSSEGSLTDARALAENLGIGFREVPIDRLFQSYLDELPAHLDSLGEAGPNDVTMENVQARIRGNVLMAISNRLGHLLLTTGNKSEVAVGYCTLYGDMAGALGVISDLPKTFVYKVSHEFNRRAGREIIPRSTLEKAPSAELRPDQTDQDSLPDYDVLDGILERHVERQQDAEEIIAGGFEPETVRRVLSLVRINEYKRKQAPPGLIVSGKAFGSGRRYPLAARFRYGA